MIEQDNFIKNLQKRLNDFKGSELFEDRVFKQDIVSVQIALSLFELAVYCDRKIIEQEKYWFEGGYYISIDINGQWKDISEMYDQLVEIAKKKRFI